MEIQNEIYAAIIGECEDAEFRGVYKGNGHHLAQRLTKLITDKLEEEEKKPQKRIPRKLLVMGKVLEHKSLKQTYGVFTDNEIYHSSTPYLFPISVTMEDMKFLGKTLLKDNTQLDDYDLVEVELTKPLDPQ